MATIDQPTEQRHPRIAMQLNDSFSDARIGSSQLFLGAYAANVPASAISAAESAGQEGTITTKLLFSVFPLATLPLSRAAQGRGNRYAAAHQARRQFNGCIRRVGQAFGVTIGWFLQRALHSTSGRSRGAPLRQARLVSR